MAFGISGAWYNSRDVASVHDTSNAAPTEMNALVCLWRFILVTVPIACWYSIRDRKSAKQESPVEIRKPLRVVGSDLPRRGTNGIPVVHRLDQRTRYGPPPVAGVVFRRRELV